MKCVECNACVKGYFKSEPDTYVCIGVKHPFKIKNIHAECTEYPEKRAKKSENNFCCVTTTATAILDENDCDNTVVHLPTAKEYREAANKVIHDFTAQWSAPMYQCPKCGGGMCKNLMITLTTWPPQYEYQCDKCGHTEYQYI